MKWWNRMIRHAHMIEGFDSTPYAVVNGEFIFGSSYVAQRVHLPGTPDVLACFVVASVAYPKSERPPKGPRS